jgi:hypothetical protein
VGDACYKTDWLQSSNEIKRSLIIVMTRANRQFAITAGKFSILSLRSLTSVSTIYIRCTLVFIFFVFLDYECILFVFCTYATTL